MPKIKKREFDTFIPSLPFSLAKGVGVQLASNCSQFCRFTFEQQPDPEKSKLAD